MRERERERERVGERDRREVMGKEKKKRVIEANGVRIKLSFRE